MRLVAGVLVLLFPWAVVAGTPLPDGPHIVVSGEGKVSVKPDSARIVFHFEQRAEQALPAKQTVDKHVNDLLDGTSRFGIASDDVRASDLTTSEDILHDKNDRRISNGFVATRNVTVVLQDMQRLNEFLDFGLATGASIFQVTLESTQAAKLRTDAKKKAVNNLREKGNEMAIAFGAKLGGIYSIDSIGSRQGNGWFSGPLDSVLVTGSHRQQGGRYLQPTVEYSETVSAVFELTR